MEYRDAPHAVRGYKFTSSNYRLHYLANSMCNSAPESVGEVQLLRWRLFAGSVSNDLT